MIAFEGVSVRYPGAARDALHEVSFVVPAGQLTAVAGPNGSGKSSCVRALLARVPLARGRITVGADDRAALDARAFARRVAVVTQREEPTFPLSVADYVALGRHPHQGAWHADARRDREAVRAALAKAGVDALADRGTDTLSGGEWQRVRVARALAQDGEALVLDEPSAFLDVGHEMALFELLATIARTGHAVLLVSHQLNLVARFADRLVLLDGGRVAADGPPARVMDGPTLERVYDWPLVVTRDPAVGAPALVPLRRATGAA
jgi:iron complex transport system ATP-binding protein